MLIYLWLDVFGLLAWLVFAYDLFDFCFGMCVCLLLCVGCYGLLFLF